MKHYWSFSFLCFESLRDKVTVQLLQIKFFLFFQVKKKLYWIFQSKWNSLVMESSRKESYPTYSFVLISKTAKISGKFWMLAGKCLMHPPPFHKQMPSHGAYTTPSLITSLISWIMNNILLQIDNNVDVSSACVFSIWYVR